LKPKKKISLQEKKKKKISPEDYHDELRPVFLLTYKPYLAGEKLGADLLSYHYPAYTYTLKNYNYII
jgi:hypothetical protein